MFLAGALPPFPSSVSFDVSAVVQFQAINRQISEVATFRDVEWLEKNRKQNKSTSLFFSFSNVFTPLHP